MGDTKTVRKVSVAISDPEQIPRGPHWAMIEKETVTIPGDERSRQAPGHGYPEHTKDFITYRVFKTEEELLEELTRLSNDPHRRKPLPLCVHVRDVAIPETRIVLKRVSPATST